MKLYFIAGEASGDNLGAKLIHALKQKAAFEIYGIGGVEMESEGLKSLFPMSEISLFGFLEVVPHIPHTLKRMKQTIEDIERVKPDAIITIDAPGFNFRIAERLRKSGNTTPLIHYVAPTVWAYKPKRAAKMALWYDLLLLLLPFEPPYFDAVGLRNVFVGHALIEDRGKKTEERKKGNLLVLPGSRRGELKRHLPIFEKTIALLGESITSVIIPTLPHLKQEIIAATKNWSVPVHITTTKKERLEAFQTADVALTKSGTVTLELALYNVPMIVTYRINPISAWLLRRMIRIQYTSMVNLLLKRMAIKELLQEDCTPELLAAAVTSLMHDQQARAAQQSAMHEALVMLGLNQTPHPSQKAAEAVLNFLKP